MAAGDVSRRRGGGVGYFDELKRGDDRGVVRKIGDEERQSGELWQFNAFGGSPRYEEGELSGNEDGVRLPLEKKRRLSPIVLGEEEKEARIFQRSSTQGFKCCFR
ncbi:hypothetical protein OIU74_016935 [Salix koriyanagi]|uniref:Uncharacterized protein n=1 Tax=Salix koriyanagi TaxID=2511006 RepID=A0A9Q0PHK4_9ROSI|nr:hypothetical protein OIU74_016935 [Salix koriyanagi]